MKKSPEIIWFESFYKIDYNDKNKSLPIIKKMIDDGFDM